MNHIVKRLTAVLAAGALTLGLSVSAFAQTFIDMPQNWTTTALEIAVKNGLLKGDGERILPDDNITRAEMAAIIVRAFGATEKTNIDKYIDVEKDKWYYEELSKAVAMGAFQGDGNKMTPQVNITFQECFTVLSQVFHLRYHEPDLSVLDQFTDGGEASDWAKEFAARIVQNGYWDGIDGKLLPTTYITRSQFAVLMDNFIQAYIDEPGEYTELPDGNVMIRTPGVNLKDVVTDDDIILGDGCDDADIILENVTCHDLLIRGGKLITVGGKYNWISLQKVGATANIGGATFNRVMSCKDTMIDFGMVIPGTVQDTPVPDDGSEVPPADEPVVTDGVAGEEPQTEE